MKMNSSLIAFFMISAIFFIHPSDEASVQASVETSKGRFVSMDSMDKHVELIHPDDRNHPDQICKRELGDKEARWVPLHMNWLPWEVCSENLACEVAKSGKTIIQLNEKVPEGSQCSLHTTEDDYLYGCLEGTCVPFARVNHRTSDS